MHRSRIESAVERGKDWLLNNQITAETPGYDTLEWLDAEHTRARWVDAPLPAYLVGAFYANLSHHDPWCTRPGEIRRQYYNSWHTAQAGVALLEYLDWKEAPTVRRAVELAWSFIDRQQVKEGPFTGVFVEVPVEALQFPLLNHHSFGHTSTKARNGYADYDNIETDLFPLELYRRTRDPQYLRAARDNADFYLRAHRPEVLLEIETTDYSISGMCNDAIYGRLAAYTEQAVYGDVFARQIQNLALLGLDLRAGNNIRNMYWDCTACLYAVDHCPALRGPALAKLLFLGEMTRAAQKEEGVLHFRYKAPGVFDDTVQGRNQDGAATYAMVPVWGKLHDITGDTRWLTAIRKAVAYALDHQYPESEYGPGFAGAFEYAGWVNSPHGRYESLRDISTIFALRALLPLLMGSTRWAEDFWTL